MTLDTTQKCPKLGAVEELISRLEAREIPADYEPGDLYYAQILADVRHTYTNYESLLLEFPYCPACPFDPDAEDNDPGIDGGNECLNAVLAHDELKWVAKARAEQAYKQWLEKRSSS